MRWVAVIAAAFAIGVLVRGNAAPAASTHACTEDMACWNCTTMGNGICGPGVLTQACVPANTGGGVTQCTQPTTFDTALLMCLRHPSAYIGHTQEDTLRLIAQCTQDYKAMRHWR